MKKVISIRVLLTALFTASLASANMVGNPGFETGCFTDWYHSAGAAIISDNGPSAPGDYAAEIPVGQDIRTVPFAVTPGQTYDVNWDYKVVADGWFWGLFRFWADENATVFMGQDAFGHDPTGWTTRSFTSSVIPAGAAYADVAFFNGTASTGSIIVDNISVVPKLPPGLNIQPENDANGIPLHAVLSWDSNSNDTSYDIYLGTDSTAVANADLNATEYIDSILADSVRMEYAITLKPYTQYYWRIDVGQNGTVNAGTVNNFTTGFDLLENVKGATFQKHNVVDNQGRPMDGLKVIENPQGGYLAVYHSYIYKSYIDKYEFDARLASSDDLISWTYCGTLQSNSSMPTIAYHSDSGGYFVAHEQWQNSGGSGASKLRFHYYPSTPALFLQNDSKDYTAPITLSPWNLEGTPNFYSISPDGDTIEVGFHYNNSGVDRIARGQLANFISDSPAWSTWSETSRNNLLISKGVGSHIGDRDHGTILGLTYTMQETMMVDGDWSSWRGWFYDHERDDYFELSPVTNGGSIAFGNGTFTSLTSPIGKDAVLVTYFLFGEGAAPGEAGPLLFYNELQTSAWHPIPVYGDTDVSAEPVLRWLAGAGTTQHDIYLGTDDAVIINAGLGSPFHLGRFNKPHIAVDDLISSTTYYWRVDEILSDDSVRKGDVWSFSTQTGVDLFDLAILVENWLNENHPGCIGDLTGDCKVTWEDYAVLTVNWLQ